MSHATLQPLCDRIGRESVERVVHAFYERIRRDSEIGHFFAGIEDFSAHEARIVDFWWIAMGGRVENPPDIDMIGKHMPLGITEEALVTWLSLFRATLAEELDGDLAGQWYQMANAIAARLLQFVVRGSPPVLRPE
jgi:hemoglobin